MLSGFQPTDKIRNSEGVDVPLSEVSVGDKLIGIDYETEEFDGANVNLNEPVLDTVVSVSTRTTENAIRLTFSDDRTMIVDAQTAFYSRPLPCGDVVNEDGTITEGCSREEGAKEAGTEAEQLYEKHSCCDKGIVAYDDSVLIEQYVDDENPPSTKLTPKTGIYNLDDNFAENDLHVVSIEELDGEYEVMDIEMEKTEMIFINGFYFIA